MLSPGLGRCQDMGSERNGSASTNLPCAPSQTAKPHERTQPPLSDRGTETTRHPNKSSRCSLNQARTAYSSTVLGTEKKSPTGDFTVLVLFGRPQWAADLTSPVVSLYLRQGLNRFDYP